MDGAALRLAWAPAPAARDARRAVAWRLVRDLLSRAGHPDAVLSHPCPRCGGPHGPILVTGAPWRAGVAYAGGLAVAAIHPDDVAAFAIDAEPLADPDRAAAGPIPGGLLRWVRVEAALKADGRGLRVAPELVEVIAGRDDWTARIPGDAAPLRGYEPDGPPGVLVSVAVRPRQAGAASAAAGARSGRATP